MVLDLCAGAGGFSAAFRNRGHDVRTLDWEPEFGCTYTADLTRWDPAALGDWRPDVVLFSPDCTKFGTQQIGRNWNRDHTPKTDAARKAWELVVAGLVVIERLQPRFYWMENPRAKLRRLMEIHRPKVPRVTVTYCRYGDPCMKATDLWGVWPGGWMPRAVCAARNPDHISAPRGSQTGTQGVGRGKTSAERALVPGELSMEICLSVEKAFAIKAPESIANETPVRAWGTAVQSRLPGVAASHLEDPLEVVKDVPKDGVAGIVIAGEAVLGGHPVLVDEFAHEGRVLHEAGYARGGY